MLIREFLTESASTVLYHYTSAKAALDILQSGQFKLSHIIGNRSETPDKFNYSFKGYPYYLSLARTRIGDYSLKRRRGVMFVIDGSWLNNRYKVKPVDYWERSWNHEGSGQSRESEDRVFSKEPTIPIDPVKSIHVLLEEKHEIDSPIIRRILLIAKKDNIPCFLYNDRKDFSLLNTRKALKPSENSDLLSGKAKKAPKYTPTNYLEPWLELIYKNNKSELSDKADKLRHSLIYYVKRDIERGDAVGQGHVDTVITQDLYNARKPENAGYDSAVKIIKYMKQNGNMTILDLIKKLIQKWDAISNPERMAA